MGEPLVTRRNWPHQRVLPKLADPIRESSVLDATLPDLVASVRVQGLEGIVAKRLDSRYEPGQRSGAWRKMRVNQGEEFVIGGYTLDGRTFDALVFGYYEDDRLMYAARQRIHTGVAGRIDAANATAGNHGVPVCEFAGGAGWALGPGTHRRENEELRLAETVLVRQFEFVEWTPDGHLRHSRFVGLREDKEAREVGREG